MGGSLVIKLVKPIKTLRSWTPYDSGVYHLLLSKTKPHVRTATTRILRKADATVRQEVCGLDSADCAFDQAAELLPLFVADGRAQILNLDQALADEHHLRHFSNAGHPRVADKLRVKGEQSFRFHRVAARTGLPL